MRLVHFAKPLILCGLSAAFGVSSIFAQSPASRQAENWFAAGKVIAPTALSGKTIGRLSDYFEITPTGQITTRENAGPLGDYIIEWEVPIPDGCQAVTVSANSYKQNLYLRDYIQAAGPGQSDWMMIGQMAKDWAWEPIRGNLFPLSNTTNRMVRVRWEFSRPANGPNCGFSLSGLKVEPVEIDKAIAEYCKPLAEGLPPLANPLTAKKPWKSKLELHDGMMWKDGEPFFPIGYVFSYGEKGMAQSVAMGCTAAHVEVGWNISQAPGLIPPEKFEGIRTELRQAAEWGLVGFPLLGGHYVPSWFAQKYPQQDYYPLGSDGKQTGCWFPYSISFSPMKNAIADFWKSAAPVLADEPNVMAINLWNEPSYGGTWNRGDQFADYRPWSTDNYRNYLQTKYGTIQKLSEAHGHNYASFEKVQPPRLPDEFGRAAWLDWMQFGQKTFADFFMWERTVIHSVAPQAMLANKKQNNMFDSSSASSGTNWYLMGKSEDIFGINIYGGFLSYRTILEAARSYAEGKPVVIFETNVMPANAAGRTPDRVRMNLWAPVLGGVRGMFIFCLSPDPEHGLLSDAAVSPEARKEYVKFTRSVGANQRELASPFVPARIAVLYSTTAALQNPGDLVSRNVQAAFRLVKDNQYQVDFLPEERCNSETLDKYELLVLPSYCILNKTACDQIGNWIKKGGKVLAFAHSLATDEFCHPIKPLLWLGINDRKPAIGNRFNLSIETVAESIKRYQDGPINITGVELVSSLTKKEAELIPGAKIDVVTAGEVLAYNSDSYPAIVADKAGNVVYCAFDSDYNSGLQLLMGGIAREICKIKQNVRLIDENGRVESAVATSLRQDYKDPNLRYLLVINSLSTSKTLTFEADGGWRIAGEKLHALAPIQKGEKTTVKLEPHEVYLFEIKK